MNKDITRKLIFTIGLVGDGKYDRAYFYVEAPNLSEALEIAIQIVPTYYKGYAIESVTGNAPCFRKID